MTMKFFEAIKINLEERFLYYYYYDYYCEVLFQPEKSHRHV